MDVTAARVHEHGNTVDFLFNKGFEEAESFYKKIATVVPSSSKQNIYGFLASRPEMREWVGPRVIQNVKTEDLTIVNKKFESTIAVARDDFDDDNLGQYSVIAEELGTVAAELPDDLVAQLILEGEAKKGYDGQEYFDTDHPVGGGTASNLFTGKPLTAANFNAVRATMRTRRSVNGRPIKVRPTLLIVPPELEAQAQEIVVAETNPNGAANVNKGKALSLIHI